MPVEVYQKSDWKTSILNKTVFVGRDKHLLNPHPSFVVTGLYPTEIYQVTLKLQLRDNYVYKFDRPGRKVFGYSFADPKAEQWLPQYLDHHEGPKLGADWEKKPIVFNQIFISSVPRVGVFLVETRRAYIISLIIKRAGEIGWEFHDPWHAFVPFTSKNAMQLDQWNLKKVEASTQTSDIEDDDDDMPVLEKMY